MPVLNTLSQVVTQTVPFSSRRTLLFRVTRHRPTVSVDVPAASQVADHLGVGQVRVEPDHGESRAARHCHRERLDLTQLAERHTLQQRAGVTETGGRGHRYTTESTHSSSVLESLKRAAGVTGTPQRVHTPAACWGHCNGRQVSQIHHREYTLQQRTGVTETATGVTGTPQRVHSPAACWGH